MASLTSCRPKPAARSAFAVSTACASRASAFWPRLSNVTFDAGPFADGLFPTNAYRWDRAAARWTDEEADFTKPVNPALTPADFAGKTAADALDLYDGSGGGTGFDLAAVGLPWIEYVRVEGVTGFAGGEIDAVADVSPVPEPAGVALIAAAGGLLCRRRRSRC